MPFEQSNGFNVFWFTTEDEEPKYFCPIDNAQLVEIKTKSIRKLKLNLLCPQCGQRYNEKNSLTNLFN